MTKDRALYPARLVVALVDRESRPDGITPA